MSGDGSSRPDEDGAELPILDMGALAQGLRTQTSWSGVVLWWAVFGLLIAACVKPNSITLSFLWLYVVILVWARHRLRRVFHENLARLPCFSRSAAVEPAPVWPHVTILVPARDEEAALYEAARSVASLSYPSLDVWFINDHSTDRTPEILDAVQREYPHVHVLHDPAVEAGWFGKSNALWQGWLEIESLSDEALAHRDWLLFTDADVVFDPDVLEQAITVAEEDHLDYLTCVPKLVARTWAEQFLLPTGWRGILQGANYERLNEPDSFPIGMGAFMLIRTDAYRAIGGHKALGQWHPEDTLMAAAVKRIGGRVGVAWSSDSLRVRFYDGYGEVKKHTLRKMRIFFGDHIPLPLSMIPMRLSTMIIGLPMVAAGVVPQVAIGHFDLSRTLLAVAGLVIYVNEAREYAGVERIAEFHPAVPWLHPVSGVLRVWFALSLTGQIIARRPMEWRGRQEFGLAGESTTRQDK